MTFKKGTFYLHNIEGAKEEFTRVDSWVDSTGVYGFHKHNGKSNCWIATDVASGYRICVAETRKGCVEWIEANMDRLVKVKSGEAYAGYVAQMNAYKESLK